jgi:S-formylglutathione hydrolase FrmB
LAPSQLAIEMVSSQALAANPLGDPARRPLIIYLPPGYEADKRTYPVLFLLAGFMGSGRSYLGWEPWGEDLQSRMDRLISKNLCRPLIVALPDAFTRYGGSQYINSSATGRYQDYLLELVEFVDSRFRTLADRQHRTIAGRSSGGFGALMAAMDHPETFGLVADHSGDAYFELCYKPQFPHFLRAVAHLGQVKSVLADPAAVRPKGADFYSVMEVAAMAACYSPNPQSELGFDLPLDLHNGELRDEVWQRWLAWDPVYRLESHLPALNSLRLLYIDCGSQDEFNINYGCRLLDQRLRDHGVPHTYLEYDDGHRNTHYRLDDSLAAISETLPG